MRFSQRRFGRVAFNKLRRKRLGRLEFAYLNFLEDVLRLKCNFQYIQFSEFWIFRERSFRNTLIKKLILEIRCIFSNADDNDNTSVKCYKSPLFRSAENVT